jgi:hypothetical protein
LTNNTLEYLENYWWVGRRSIPRMMVGRIYLDSIQGRNDTGIMARLPANHQLHVYMFAFHFSPIRLLESGKDGTGLRFFRCSERLQMTEAV